MKEYYTEKENVFHKTRKLLRMDKAERRQLDITERLLNLFERHISSSIKITDTLHDSEFIDAKDMLVWGPEVNEMINEGNKTNMALVIPVPYAEGKFMCYVMSAGAEQAFIDYEYPDYWKERGYAIKYIYKNNKK